MAELKNPRNGQVVIRIGQNVFHMPTNGTGEAVTELMYKQMKKIQDAGGDFDYVAGYPKTGDAYVAIRKGMRPEQFPELMDVA
jgi:hypothetical protein